MRVFVTGGTGVLGRALLPELVRGGHSVDVLTPNERGATLAATLGARPVQGDLLHPDGLAPIEADAVIHFATSIPRPDSGTGSWAVNDRIRTLGTANLLAAARAGRVRRVVGYSVVWVYGDGGDQWITEDFVLPTVVRPEIRSAVALEEAVRASGFDWVILRGGWLYGPGTGTTEELLAGAAAGRLRTDGNGRSFHSLVTAEDTAQAARLALERIPPGMVVNVVDDQPLRQIDLYRILAAHVGGPEPGRGPEVLGCGSLRVSNARARFFGFRPRYSNVAAGLRGLFPTTVDWRLASSEIHL